MDFPKDPILDGNAPTQSPMVFGMPGAGGDGGSAAGPCLDDPEIGALFPHNWLRMRFHFTPGPGENLFEIRVHSSGETNDLVVYTTNTTWTMPADLWSKITTHLADYAFTVSVRGVGWDGMKPTTPVGDGTKGDVTVASVDAAGAIVYWTTTGGSALKGFALPQETVTPVLTPQQVQMKTNGGADVSCIGCHTSTPDGASAGFTAQSPWANALADIAQGATGGVPAYLTTAAQQALSQGEVGIQTFSRNHFAPGDRIEIAPLGSFAASQLAWFDLEATDPSMGVGFGILARTGDAHGAGAPSWSHDGKTIAYVSTDTEKTGRLDAGDADLFTVPYNGRMGGAATPLPGASDPAVEEYYPSYSPDDRFLAYDVIPQGLNMYNQPMAELYVIDAAGGTGTRLRANDPPACTGRTSPGITNSWPKWSPEAVTHGNKTYYWLTFSSTRDEMMNPQLYVTAVVVDNSEVTQKVNTYAACYLWNQPAMENNHTPAWDVFQIPVQ